MGVIPSGSEYRLRRLNGELTDSKGNYSQFNQEKYKFFLDAPFEISDLCCDIMKKKPAHDYEKETGRKPIMATMASESVMRTQKWLHRTAVMLLMSQDHTATLWRFGLTKMCYFISKRMRNA